MADTQKLDSNVIFQIQIPYDLDWWGEDDGCFGSDVGKDQEPITMNFFILLDGSISVRNQMGTEYILLPNDTLVRLEKSNGKLQSRTLEHPPVVNSGLEQRRINTAVYTCWDLTKKTENYNNLTERQLQVVEHFFAAVKNAFPQEFAQTE